MRDNPEPEYRGKINLDGETRTYRVNDVEYMVTSHFAESLEPEDGVTLTDVIESIISNEYEYLLRGFNMSDLRFYVQKGR